MLPAPHGLHAGGEPFFRDVLVHRKPGVLLKQMGDVVFAQIQLPAHRVETQVAAQIVADIAGDALIGRARSLFRL